MGLRNFKGVKIFFLGGGSNFSGGVEIFQERLKFYRRD